MKRTKIEFATDALAFNEEVKQLEAELRVKVKKLEEKYSIRTAGYNFPVIYDPLNEHGVIYLRSLPEYWTVEEVANTLSF